MTLHLNAFLIVSWVEALDREKVQDYSSFYNWMTLYAMLNSTKFTTFIQLGNVFMMKWSYKSLLTISSKVYRILIAWGQWLTIILITVALHHFLLTKLWILDDLLCDIVSRKDDLIQKLVTVYSNHKKWVLLC